MPTPEPLFFIASFIFGAIFGSFINALSFRFNTGKGIGGRSRCMQCGHTLHAVDLVPILSYLFLRGRCRYCSTKISMQYPLVELVAGALSLGAFIISGATLAFLFWLFVWLVVLFLVVYDARHMILPWSASLTLLALACASLLLFTPLTQLDWWAGPLLALPLFLLSLVSRGRWMGWADSLFELSLGALLGFTHGLTALMLAFWVGAFAGLCTIAVAQLRWKSGARRFTMNSEIPFAPYLALGAAIVYFFNVDFFSTLPLLFQ